MTTSALSIGQPDFVAAVTAATKAPSMHNTQPWRFRLVAGCLEVHGDPERQLPVADPAGRAVRVACGAAVANARIALAAARLRTDVELRPDPEQPHLLARLRPVDWAPPTLEEQALHAAIPRRHSNRMPFLDKPVPPELRARLRTAAQEAGAWLDLLVGRGPLAVVSEIVWAADAALRRDARYRAEQLAWSGRTAGADGVPARAAVPVPAADHLLPMRDFGAAPVTDGPAYRGDPLVAVLGTAGDTPQEQLGAGMALERVLLTATDAGLATSMLSQAIEVPAAREQLRIGLGRFGVPQMLLRVGYGHPTFASPRRPTEDVIDV